jgi:hypothetical protein
VPSRIALSKTQKAMLVWCMAFLVAAELIKYFSIDERVATKIGLIEVLLAICTGIAFGVATSARNE